MLPRDYANQLCPIARTLEIVGDRWTLLVIREAFLGTRRFNDFHDRLGAARTVLTDRLGRLVADGILERVPYQERPERFEYQLTDKGLDLWPVLVALLQWGDRHAMGGQRTLALRHRGCGGELTDRRACAACGRELTVREVERVWISPDPDPRLTQPTAPHQIA